MHRSDRVKCWWVMQHAQGCVIALAAIGAASALLRVPPKWRNSKATKTRWFALHAIVNLAVSFFALPDLIATLNRPSLAMLDDMRSWVPSYLSFSVHVYHLLEGMMGDGIRSEDLAHHVIFVGVFGAVNFAFVWGPIVNVLLFFITGIPGGLNYVLLVLRREGLMTSLQQKELYRTIDVWFRMPGLVCVACLMAINTIERRIRVPPIAAFGCALLASLNGIYYMQQAVVSLESSRSNISQNETATLQSRREHDRNRGEVPSLLKNLGCQIQMKDSTTSADDKIISLLGSENKYWIRQYNSWADRENSSRQATGYVPSVELRARDFLSMLKNGVAASRGLYLAMFAGSTTDSSLKASFQNELRRICHVTKATKLAGHTAWSELSPKDSELCLWLGPPGHVEHLHMDGYSNIHFQLCGKKTWHLFPPSSKLSPAPILSSLSRDNHFQHNFSTLTLHEAMNVAPVTTIVVRAGDAIHIPAGWWHQVESDVEETEGNSQYVASVNLFEPTTLIPWTRLLKWHFLRLHVGDWISHYCDLVHESVLRRHPGMVEMPPAKEGAE